MKIEGYFFIAVFYTNFTIVEFYKSINLEIEL